MPRRRLLPLAVTAAALLAACSGAIRRTSTADGPARSDPPAADTAAAGTYVVLGGEILDARPTGDGGTRLVVLRRPLSEAGRPSAALRGQGVFGVRYPERLDPHLFRRGQRVTVDGVVRGEKPAAGGAPLDPALWLDGLKVRIWDRPEWPLATRLAGRKEWRPWWYDPYYGDRPWWW